MTEQITLESGRNLSVGSKQGQELRCQLDRHLQEIQALFLLRLIHGDMNDLNTIILQARQLNLPCDGYQHNICVVASAADASAVDAATVLCMVREEICFLADTCGVHLAFCMDQQCRLILMISTKPERDGITLFINKLPKWLLAISERTGIDLLFGTGLKVDQIELLSESYGYAVSILEHTMSLGLAEGGRAHEAELTCSGNVHQQLLQMFRECDMKSIAETVNKHVETIKLHTTGRQVLIERFAVLYLQNITNECMRLGVSLERFESYVPAVVCLMQLDSIGSVEEILRLTEQILKYLNVRGTIEGNHLLNMAKDYISENIGNERLDLAAVSDHVGLSRVYFCKLFHQIEGVNFSTYLKKVRIEKAKQLLLTTNMKVFEVSNAVGFSHAKYFGHVFKEVVGQTPVEFQKGIRSDA